MKLYLTTVMVLCSLLCWSQKGENDDSFPTESEEGLYTHDKSACGTADVSYEDWIGQIRKYGSTPLKNGVVNQLPLRAHIVTKDDGTGGLSLTDLNEALANLNHMYFDADMEWFIADINYINDTDYYDFSSADENLLCSPHEVDDAVNVFFVNSIDGGIYCGYAYLPFNSDVSLRILMDNECTSTYLNGTFVHEFGHHLNLQHTHRGTSNGNTDPNAEHVPRTGSQSNCDTHGDFICDTEADPTGSLDSNCQYNGGESDVYGNPYDPLEDNVMSYYTDACGGSFTPGQYSVMSTGLSVRMGHTAYDIDGAQPASVTDPSNLAVVNNSLSVTLNWTDNSNNETGFLVERSEDGGTTFMALPFGGVAPNTSSYVDDNIMPSTEYHYRVKASNDNPDHYSNTVIFTSDNCQTESLVFSGGLLADTPVSLMNVPTSMPSCQDSAEVTIQVIGDFGANFEICDIMGEDNTTVLSQTSQSSLDCAIDGGVSSFFIQTSDYNNWAGDGSLTFYIAANNLVNEFCTVNLVTACISLDDCGSSNCPSDYTGPNQLTGMQDTSATFETDGMLMSDQTIAPGVNVIYDSGVGIEILAGFEIMIGSTFDAMIDGCDN